MVAWTDTSPDERARSTLQYHWSRWGSWQPTDWTLELVVVRDGVVVGSQGVGGRDFAVLREVSTGSWLGRHYQGRGIGTQMRAAALHLAFEGLKARHAVSAAFEDNAASLGVSRKLGYRDDGTEWHVVRGRPAVMPPAAPDAGRLAGNADGPGADPRPGALPAPFRAAARGLTGAGQGPGSPGAPSPARRRPRWRRRGRPPCPDPAPARRSPGEAARPAGRCARGRCRGTSRGSWAPPRPRRRRGSTRAGR